jgi:hypothetical protein
MKPQMPKEPIKFTASAEAHLMFDSDRYSSGSLGMALEVATISNSKKTLGEVHLCMGGGVSVIIGQHTWGIDPVTLYKIAKQADDAYKLSKAKD